MKKFNLPENPFSRDYSFAELLKEADKKKKKRIKKAETGSTIKREFKEHSTEIFSLAAKKLKNTVRVKNFKNNTTGIFKSKFIGNLINISFLKKLRTQPHKSKTRKKSRPLHAIYTYALPICAILLFIGVVSFLSSLQVGFVIKSDNVSITVLESEASFQRVSEKMNDALMAVENKNPSEAPQVEVTFLNFSSEKIDTSEGAYEKMLKSETVTSTGAGLYIDGKLMGAADTKSGLQRALSEVLRESKANYDSLATASFYNDIKIEEDVFPKAALKQPEELVESCKDLLTVQLSSSVDYYSLNHDTTDIEEQDNGKEDKETQTFQYLLFSSEKKRYDSPKGNGMFEWPVPYTINITSWFGPRWGTFHYGIDIAEGGVNGQDIIAAGDGTVTYAGIDNSGYGYHVVIDHGNGYKTLYGHAQKVTCEAGDTVKTGDVIAKVGSTGDSTGPHLHFEVIENGVKKDPLLYL